MNIELLYENNQLSKKDPEQTINYNTTDVKFHLTIEEGLEEYIFYCLLKTRHFIYRLKFKEVEDGYECTMPQQASTYEYIKVSLYGIKDDKRITTNELIIPILDSGYMFDKPHHCDCHRGKCHTGYIHNFPYHFSLSPKHRCHKKHHRPYHGSGICKPPYAWDKWDKMEWYEHLITHHGFGRVPHHHFNPRDENEYADIFDYIVAELNHNVDYVVFDGNGCHAYYNGNVVKDVMFFDNGDIVVSNKLID